MNPPEHLVSWLTWTQSLTEKLRLCAGDASLQVLKHQWEDSDAWDKSVLNLHDTRVIHREILMYAHQVPCWYARTILPLETILADEALFERLKQESLGQLIFNSGRVERRSIKHQLIEPTSFEWAWLPANAFSKTVSKPPVHLWYRLSEFGLIASAHRFYLLEILLPGLEQFVCVN